jgi:hypothetical protein
MLTSGAGIVGEGVGWSGSLEQDIHKVKRVRYCKECRRALDFHALLRGKLDYRHYGSWGGLWTFIPCVPILWVGLSFPFWASVLLALIAAFIVGWLFDRLERRKVSRWALSSEEAERLSGEKK